MGDTSVPEVVLICGVSGAGKTTLALVFEARGYVRLSVDEEIWERFGRFGIDYDPSSYEANSTVTRGTVDARLTGLVVQGRDVVIDSSLWQRSRLHEVKWLVEHAGGRWPLPTVSNFVETWKAMEDFYGSGRARTIGVSNFEPHHLRRLNAETTHLQRGDIVFPKSVTRSRIEENFAIFDCELSDVGLADRSGLNRDERTGPDPDTFDYVLR